MKPVLLLFCVACSAFCLADDDKIGHSHYGPAFDAGLRGKPWKIAGIGNAHLPITTKNPEVQAWFDQGVNLMHSFWFEEAERSFRWASKLDPESPMPYFGMAMTGINWFTYRDINGDNAKRYRAFLTEAIKRKGAASERERMYIEAWEACLEPGVDIEKTMVLKLQELCIKYPEDIEAKAFLGLYNIRQGSTLANDALLRQVLQANPMHPGAHHAMIHNWDGLDSAKALDSCELYGRSAPGIGHALHMPGHIYTKVGMWHEAAIAMDSATRVELKYMNERFTLPYELWNYAHNRDYLCYIQEQLGRGEASIQGAIDMTNTPTDPMAAVASDAQYPRELALIRALVKFERWEQILDGKTLTDASNPMALLLRQDAEALALLGLGRVKEAAERIKAIKDAAAKLLNEEIAKDPAKADVVRKQHADNPDAFAQVAEAWLKIAQGDRMGGIQILLATADWEAKARAEHRYGDDPPSYAWPVMRLVGDAFYKGKDYHAAVEAYEKALAQELNDGWCLAGLAKSWAALGDKAKASDYAGRLMAVWDGADKGLKPMEEVMALNLGVKAHAVTLRPERKYDPAALDKIGPSNWRPFTPPELQAVNPDGKAVKLSDYRGKNVVLVFYLTDECVHCAEQLASLSAKSAEFEKENTVILAVSGDKPEKNKANALASLGMTLLSDTNHANARRFASYDDFEDLEVHSTILIDKDGRVRWKHTGGDPFTKVDFLLSEIKRWKS